MRMKLHFWALIAGVAIFVATPAAADLFSFSTGTPDGLIGTLSRPGSLGKLETETADDFVLTATTTINRATITGLLPAGSPLSNIKNVEVEVYHVFPADSATPPSGSVPSRANSPADVEIASATRDGSAGSLGFSAVILNPSFHVANTVVNGINKSLTPFTGGEGPTTGEEVVITINFNTPIVLPADHYFFRPEVELDNGDFLWLSAPKPIVPPGTPFPPGSTDLQSWIRNTDLKPDWLRIGTDITHQGPFNAAFSLAEVPEPSTLLLLGSGLAGLGGIVWRKNRKRQ
jgi:hypothetical protein